MGGKGTNRTGQGDSRTFQTYRIITFNIYHKPLNGANRTSTTPIGYKEHSRTKRTLEDI